MLQRYFLYLAKFLHTSANTFSKTVLFVHIVIIVLIAFSILHKSENNFVWIIKIIM